MDKINNTVIPTDNEIIIYQADDELKLDVRVEEETVWLSQQQMVELFQVTKQNVSLHISNIYKEGELEKSSTVKEYLTVQIEGNRTIKRKVAFYNLDVIISVGYRVKSLRGTQFRQWASRIIKEHLLRGYSVNQRLLLLEDRIDRRLSEHDRQLLDLHQKVDFVVKSSIQPKEGIFFQGQIFDAYVFVADLIRKAHKRIVIIDNYIDDTVLVQLAKRNTYQKAHDRFMIIDEEVYHIGASLKDLGKKLFAFSKMDVMTGTELISML